MSGGRRKNKNPQKWEDIQDDSQNCYSSSNEQSQMNVYNSPRSNPNNTYQNFNKEEKCRSKPYYISDSPKAHLKKNKVNHEGGMTVLDIFQGSRQGLIAECKACSIQLKDWHSTINHIRSHRLVFIPPCAKEGGNYSINRSVTCLLCKKVCQNLSVLAFHAHTEHSLTEAPFICPFCGRMFSTGSLIQKHIDIKDVCMKCPVCSATYDQEYKLYSHLSDCLPTFHPHLKSLTCHVCKDRIAMDFLADHMISHTIHGHEGRQTKPRRKSGGSPQCSRGASYVEDMKPRIFLCEICDRRFTSFDNFRSHLFEHTETKMYCPLCFLKGFERMDFIVRHLMLRCPRRSLEQMEFGCVISLIGKEQKLNFLQVVREINHLQPFRDGLRTWNNVPLVNELLNSINSLRREDLRGLSLPTDIDLLAWLSDFEKEIQKNRTDLWNSHDKNESSKNVGFSYSDKSLANVPMKIEKPNDYETQNMGKLKSYPEYKPSIEDIRKAYPKIILFHDVDVQRLKTLHDEATQLVEKDFLKESIENGTYTPEDFVRLEWEAQYLRTKEPFYFPVIKGKKELSPLFKSQNLNKKTSLKSVDPETLKRIEEELKQENAKSMAKEVLDLSVDKERLDALLAEAKTC